MGSYYPAGYPATYLPTYLPDVTCNPFEREKESGVPPLARRINNDTINLSHFPLTSADTSTAVAVARSPFCSCRWAAKQLKSGLRLERACYDRAPTFIIFLPRTLGSVPRNHLRGIRTLSGSPRNPLSSSFSLSP